MATVLDYAKADLRVGVIEKPPKSNKHPIIDLSLKPFGLKAQPWCAAIESRWFRLAAPMGHSGENCFPYSASSQHIKREFAKDGLLSDDPNDLKEWGGAIFVWTNAGDPAHGHTGLVIGRLTDQEGNVVAILTIEGNTDKLGDRLGDGLYQLKRVQCTDGLWRVEDPASKKPVGKGQHLFFGNTTRLPGGDYWEPLP